MPRATVICFHAVHALQVDFHTAAGHGGVWCNAFLTPLAMSETHPSAEIC